MSIDFPTYKDYCNDRAQNGYQVIPEKLWNALKSEQDARR